MASVVHSMRRSEAIVASMSRPSTFTVMVSPSFRPKACASDSSKEMSCGP
jgi:hypothetical protein